LNEIGVRTKADHVLVGDYVVHSDSAGGGQIKLHARLVEVGKGRSVAEASLLMSLTEEMRAMLEQPSPVDPALRQVETGEFRIRQHHGNRNLFDLTPLQIEANEHCRPVGQIARLHRTSIEGKFQTGVFTCVEVGIGRP
jgi:hypothetical protein